MWVWYNGKCCVDVSGLTVLLCIGAGAIQESHLHCHVLLRKQGGECGIGGRKDGDASWLPLRDAVGQPSAVQRSTEGAQVVVVENIIDGGIAVGTCDMHGGDNKAGQGRAEDVCMWWD